MQQRRGGSRRRELFARCMEPVIRIESTHPLVLLADEIDWTTIVRGKVGKAVEFGLNWGMTRLKGGFVLARRALDRKELGDTKFAVEAVKDHVARFGQAPRAFAYDRGGYSART